MEDRQRKLHRVLYNYYSSHRKMPTWDVLIRSTGKSKLQLIEVVDNMQAVGILKWSDSESTTIELFQLPGQSAKDSFDNGQRYFTDY